MVSLNLQQSLRRNFNSAIITIIVRSLKFPCLQYTSIHSYLFSLNSWARTSWAHIADISARLSLIALRYRVTGSARKQTHIQCQGHPGSVRFGSLPEKPAGILWLPSSASRICVRCAQTWEIPGRTALTWRWHRGQSAAARKWAQTLARFSPQHCNTRRMDYRVRSLYIAYMRDWGYCGQGWRVGENSPPLSIFLKHK